MQNKDLVNYGIYQCDWVFHEDIQNQSKNPQSKNRTVLLVRNGSTWKMYKITHINHPKYYSILNWRTSGLSVQSYIKPWDSRSVDPRFITNFRGVLSLEDINNLKSKKLLEDKKKKNVLGAFVTLDAGDVEKTIDIFNDSIADNIGTTAIAEDLELTEQLLTEGKIVTFDGETNPNNGWIVVMAGGSGSGKGFVFNTLVPFHGKKLDPDELKPYIIKTSEILGDEIVFKDGSRVNLLDAGIDPPYNLSNPEFVALIHTHPLTKRLKKQQKDMLFKSASTADERRLPNIIFDTTLDELSKLEAIVDTYKPLGYKIAVVYVFTPIDAAVNQNELRPRKVPKEILLDIHRGVYRTLPALLHDKELLSQINDIWVVQQYSIDINDKQSVVDYIRKNNVTKLPKNSDGLQYLEGEMSDFVETQLSRIAELEKEMHDSNIKAKSLEDADFGSSMDGGKIIEEFLLENCSEGCELAYQQFEDILDEYFPFRNEIDRRIDDLYAEHEGDPDWDEAYEKWNAEMGADEDGTEI